MHLVWLRRLLTFQSEKGFQFGLLLVLTFGALRLDAEIVTSSAASTRIRYGVERLQRALDTLPEASRAVRVVVGLRSDPELPALIGPGYTDETVAPRKEGFVIRSLGTVWMIAGDDDSGTLYGCLELASRLQREGRFPHGAFTFSDAPAFVLRGPCIGMQKPVLLPGRKVYEYPYTPELFPFFYDLAFWREYLDFLVDHRFNTLYLWNGHPFGSLVRVPGYPEAMEVPEDVFARNQEMLHALTAEADRRGIWVVQQFYNILLPLPFAQKHGLSTQLDAPTPLAADYTRKAVAEFVRAYPHVGLMVCLGEALQNQEHQTRWCTEVILAGVKDGMRAAGLTEEPPIVLRTHATDARIVVPEALKVYRNLYTEQKFNGESLTTWEPRGDRQALHQEMSRLGSTHVANVHILANLEPFRYGAQRFIQKSVLAMRDRLGARGLHLYPLFYWTWPDSPDLAPTPLKQWERDWIWFEAWARYAWKPDIDPVTDRAYWVGRLTEHYGDPAAAAAILDAYNDSGECAPRLLRRFGITEGNRQTLALGMTLDELVHPEKYRPFPELWESQSPPGERLQEFVDREARGLPHIGETPPQIVAEVRDYSARAVAAIEAAAPGVTRGREEFIRLRNDIHSIRALSLSYASKVEAALAVLRYERSRDPDDLRRAEPALADSLEQFRLLEHLTRETYSAANSMQTSQRRIPVPGGVGGKAVHFHWTQMLPIYERELTDFRRQLESLTAPGTGGVRKPAAFKPVRFTLLSKQLETYTLQVGNTVFSDSSAALTAVAPELQGLSGIRFSLAEARSGRLPPVEIECAQPVRILVGYFNQTGPGWRRPPTLETDATAADRGGAEPLLVNAVEFDTLPAMTVHAFEYPAGRHRLEVRGTGAFLILGVVAVESP
ncbi:MAG: hypothetical protein U1F61_28465 [Opitutaceae bacterium]